MNQQRTRLSYDYFRATAAFFSTVTIRSLLAVLVLLNYSGCSKKEGATGSPNTQATTPVDPTEAALADMTQALRRYAMEHHGLPKNFAELISAGYVKNPPTAPAGKKFEIDPKASRVILVKS